jgi:hypothetical protein
LVDLQYWNNIGGAHANANLAVVSRASDSIDVFVVQDVPGPFRVGRNWWNGSAWQGWEDLGSPPAGLNLAYSPAAIARPGNQLDVFVVSLAFVLYGNHWEGSGWSGWQTVGALIPGAKGLSVVCPLVASNVALFVRGGDGAVYCKFLADSDSASGIPWKNLGGNATAGPLTAVSWGLGRLGLFAAEGGNGPIFYKSYDPQLGADGWLPSLTGWDSLGGVVTSPFNLKAVSPSPNRLDVFFSGEDEQGSGVFHKWGDGSQWGDEWEHLWGPGISHLQAVTWGADRIDLFCRGGSGGSNPKSVYHRSWDGAAWSPAPDAEWEDIVGEFYVGNGPGVASWGPNRLDVFMVADPATDGDANVWQRWWNGTAWGPTKLIVSRPRA